MIPNHTHFIEAIHARKKVWVRFYSRPDSGVLDHVCAPMDYGPGGGITDGLNRYWLWDYTSSTDPHTLGLVPQQIVDLQVLGDVFDPAQLNVRAPQWSIPRNWGSSPPSIDSPIVAPTPASVAAITAEGPAQRSETTPGNRDSIMKSNTLNLLLVTVATLMIGCDKPDSTTQQLDRIQEKTAAAAQDLKEQDYSYAQKAEFTAQMQSRLAEITQELDLLAAKIEKSSAAARAEAKPKLQALREQAARVKTQLEEAQNATASTWETVKANSRKAYDELKDGFNQARQWVSEKIAP